MFLKNYSAIMCNSQQIFFSLSFHIFIFNFVFYFLISDTEEEEVEEEEKEKLPLPIFKSRYELQEVLFCIFTDYICNCSAVCNLS